MRNKFREALTSEEGILGYRISDLLGIAIMLIPFIISITFNYTSQVKGLLWTKSQVSVGIQPGLISSLCSVVFYTSLLVRYEGIFRATNLLTAIISSLRAFLNCWVLAALIGIVIPTGINVSSNSLSFLSLFRNPEATLLIFAILLSWLGMKSIAGYSWVLFIVAAWKNILTINSAMRMEGAVFVMSLAISLFLQMKDYTEIKDFVREFRGSASKHGETVRGDIEAAKDDAKKKVEVLGEAVGECVRDVSGRQKSSTLDTNNRSDKNVKVELQSLDINHDGVVDINDFVLMCQNKGREKENSKETANE